MRVLLSSALISIGALSLATSASAATNNAMKVCSTKYQAAKAGKTLPAGETWNQFLAECRKGLGTPAAAAPAPAPARPTLAAATRTSPASHLPGAQSPAMVAMHDRQRQCGQQWKADKAAGKIPAGQTWPKYWSACNTRLKH